MFIVKAGTKSVHKMASLETIGDTIPARKVYNTVCGQALPAEKVTELHDAAVTCKACKAAIAAKAGK